MLEDPRTHARTLVSPWLAAACLVAVAAIPFRLTAKSAGTTTEGVTNNIATKTANSTKPETLTSQSRSAASVTPDESRPGLAFNQVPNRQSDTEDASGAKARERYRQRIEAKRQAAVDNLHVATEAASKSYNEAMRLYLEANLEQAVERLNPELAAARQLVTQTAVRQAFVNGQDIGYAPQDPGQAAEYQKRLQEWERQVQQLSRDYAAAQERFKALIEEAKRQPAFGDIAPGRAAQTPGVKAPAKIKHVDPIYPPVAKEQAIAGPVALRLEVGGDGVVQEAAIVSGAHALLIQAARDALRQWRFQPMLVNGYPTPFSYNVLIVFQLAGQPAMDAAGTSALLRLTFLGQEPADRGETLTVTGR